MADSGNNSSDASRKRRSANIRTGLVLAAVAFAFYMIVIVKHNLLGL